MSAVQEQTCTWPGKTGAQYQYWVHSLPTTFNPNQDGNYIFASLVADIGFPSMLEKVTWEIALAAIITKRHASGTRVRRTSTFTQIQTWQPDNGKKATYSPNSRRHTLQLVAI